MRRFWIVLFAPFLTAATPSSDPLQKRLVRRAAELLDEAQISYVYGGYQVGDSTACKECNDCLADKAPSPKDRLRLCSMCTSCSLDCSHFAHLVFKDAGAPFPYLDTKTMLALSGEALMRRYGLMDIGRDAAAAAAGDLLVYDGHVVMLERRHKAVAGRTGPRGDIVHATGGKDVKGPGEGIQRERFVDLQAFRGPLLRVLRHKMLQAQDTPPLPDKALPRLRPVAKRPPNGD